MKLFARDMILGVAVPLQSVAVANWDRIDEMVRRANYYGSFLIMILSGTLVLRRWYLHFIRNSSLVQKWALRRAQRRQRRQELANSDRAD